MKSHPLDRVSMSASALRLIAVSTVRLGHHEQQATQAVYLLFPEIGCRRRSVACKNAERSGTMDVLDALREGRRKGTRSTGQRGRASGTHEPKGEARKKFHVSPHLTIATNVTGCARAKWVALLHRAAYIRASMGRPRNSHAVRWQLGQIPHSVRADTVTPRCAGSCVH